VSKSSQRIETEDLEVQGTITATGGIVVPVDPPDNPPGLTLGGVTRTAWPVDADIAGLSVNGNPTTVAAAGQSITASTDKTVLARSGSSLAFQKLNNDFFGSGNANSPLRVTNIQSSRLSDTTYVSNTNYYSAYARFVIASFSNAIAGSDLADFQIKIVSGNGDAIGAGTVLARAVLNPFTAGSNAEILSISAFIPAGYTFGIWKSSGALRDTISVTTFG
jgi:hypothetical protein